MQSDEVDRKRHGLVCLCMCVLKGLCTLSEEGEHPLQVRQMIWRQFCLQINAVNLCVLYLGIAMNALYFHSQERDIVLLLLDTKNKYTKYHF